MHAHTHTCIRIEITGKVGTKILKKVKVKLQLWPQNMVCVDMEANHTFNKKILLNSVAVKTSRCISNHTFLIWQWIEMKLEAVAAFFFSREINAEIYLVGGWLSPRTSLDVLAHRKIPFILESKLIYLFIYLLILL
jgi:hypothetical protein